MIEYGNGQRKPHSGRGRDCCDSTDRTVTAATPSPLRRASSRLQSDRNHQHRRNYHQHGYGCHWTVARQYCNSQSNLYQRPIRIWHTDRKNGKEQKNSVMTNLPLFGLYLRSIVPTLFYGSLLFRFEGRTRTVVHSLDAGRCWRYVLSAYETPYCACPVWNSTNSNGHFLAS